MRVTQKMLDQLLETYVFTVGGRVAQWYGDKGAYHFENSYGQNRIVQIVNESGGVADISPRLPTGELFRWMHAGIKAVDEYRRNTGQLPY